MNLPIEDIKVHKLLYMNCIESNTNLTINVLLLYEPTKDGIYVAIYIFYIIGGVVFIVLIATVAIVCFNKYNMKLLNQSDCITDSIIMSNLKNSPSEHKQVDDGQILDNEYVHVAVIDFHDSVNKYLNRKASNSVSYECPKLGYRPENYKEDENDFYENAVYNSRTFINESMCK